METQMNRQMPFKKAFFVFFMLSAMFGGYHFRESLASLEPTSLFKDEVEERAGRFIVRLSQTPNFNRYDTYIWESATASGIDPNLWKALIMTESAGDEQALSAKGAMGLSQLMPPTARSLGLDHEDSFDPEANLRAGASYLGWLMVRFGGKTELALAAYNAGPEAVRRHGGIPNYQETQKYVSTIMTLYRWIQQNPQSWSHQRQPIGSATTQIPGGMRLAATFTIAG